MRQWALIEKNLSDYLRPVQFRYFAFVLRETGCVVQVNRINLWKVQKRLLEKDGVMLWID
jgi:hypothetical protein